MLVLLARHFVGVNRQTAQTSFVMARFSDLSVKTGCLYRQFSYLNCNSSVSKSKSIAKKSPIVNHQITRSMRIVQFTLPGSNEVKVGGQLGLNGDVVDLTKALGVKSTIELIEGGTQLQEKAQKSLNAENKLPLNQVSLVAPVTKPDKVLCIGMNYKDHCEEQNKPIPEEPLVFNKYPSCIIGPHDPIPYPEITKELDWEVELVIVIGKAGFHIAKEKALDHVYGFTVAHDVSARDWQLKKNAGQWLLGKAMDGFCPLGPALVTKDEIPDPHNLNLGCKVNGVAKQDSNTRQLVFKTEDIVAWCSQFCTLRPGDIILTGTPPGVGCFMKPPQFLQKGDEVECWIEKIGSIKNAVVGKN